MRGIVPAMALVVALSIPCTVSGQRFLTAGGGASFPVGGSRAMMHPGWVTELMAGAVLPGGYSSVRVGAMLGRSRVGSDDGMSGGMTTVEPGTQRMAGLMAGLMAMPRWDYDWMPYGFLSAGGVNSKLVGSVNSFAWATGVGVVLKWRAVDFYAESRFLQARKSGGTGEMVSLTGGLRFTR